MSHFQCRNTSRKGAQAQRGLRILKIGRRAAAPARCAREGAREEKDLDVGAPLWVPRPILIVEKKVFWPRREALGATTPRDNTVSGERGEVCPEYVAPVSRPACRYGSPDSAPQSTVLPSSARVSRTRAINGGQGRGAGTYATSAPQAKNNPRRTLTPRSACNSTNLRLPSPNRLRVIVPEPVA